MKNFPKNKEGIILANKGKITERDLEVIEFLEKYKVATTTTLEEFIYPSKRVAQRRLKILYEKKYIKRNQDYIGEDYYYYLKKPKQLKHAILITEFYREFSKFFQIEHFKTEKKFNGIIPDGIIGYYDNGQKIGFLEVEISNKGFNYNKYKRICSNMKKEMGMNPKIFVVTKHKLKKVEGLDLVKIWDLEKDLEKYFRKMERRLVV